MRLIAGVAVCALAGCTSATSAEHTPSGPASSCPPPTVQPPTTAVAMQSSLDGISPAARSPSGASSSKAPGLPSDGHTQSVAFFDFCTEKMTQVILVHITNTVLKSASAGRQYEVAHVTIESGGRPLHYGPADFRYVAANGETYDPLTKTMPEPAQKILGRGTLVAGNEAAGDVVFDVPNGSGKVTFRSELGEACSLGRQVLSTCDTTRPEARITALAYLRRTTLPR